MTYPLSSDVTDGQPTAYQHYNNLRADALTLGQLPADAVTLGAALARYAANLVVVPLATDRLRVPYDALKPCTLMIDGYLCKAAADIDLAANTFSGLAATWYLFANRAAGSTTFTLTANTSQAESAGQRRIATIVWNGTHLNYDSLIVYSGKPDVYYVKLSRVAAQAIANGSDTTISWDTEDIDTDAMFAAGTPTRVTIVHAGFYLIIFQLNTTGSIAAQMAKIMLNGTPIIALTQFNANAANLSALIYLNAGDYVEAKVYNSGYTPTTAAPTTLVVAALSA